MYGAEGSTEDSTVGPVGAIDGHGRLKIVIGGGGGSQITIGSRINCWVKSSCKCWNNGGI